MASMQQVWLSALFPPAPGHLAVICTVYLGTGNRLSNHWTSQAWDQRPDLTGPWALFAGETRSVRLERGLVTGDPVGLQPEQGAGPGAGDLQDADDDQHRPADQAERAGVPTGEAECRHAALERQRDDQERDA